MEYSELRRMEYSELNKENFKNEERIRELKALLDVIVKHNENLNEELALCYEERAVIMKIENMIYMARGGCYGMP